MKEEKCGEESCECKLRANRTKDFVSPSVEPLVEALLPTAPPTIFAVSTNGLEEGLAELHSGHNTNKTTNTNQHNPVRFYRRFYRRRPKTHTNMLQNLPIRHCRQLLKHHQGKWNVLLRGARTRKKGGHHTLSAVIFPFIAHFLAAHLPVGSELDVGPVISRHRPLCPCFHAHIFPDS